MCTMLGGQQTSVTDPTNKTTTYQYDALGRVLTITHPDSTQDTFTYYPDGKQKTKVNSAGTTSDSYDALGRLISEVSGIPQTTASYTYDADGNKLTELDNYPGGTSTTITWTYDPLDRQATMNDGIRSFTYNINGAVTQIVVNVPGIGNAVEADMTYDGASRMASLIDKVSSTGSTLHSYSYQYDLQGNRTQITEDGTTTTYQYDQLNQLTKVTQGATTVTYKYDANSNRISMQTGSGTTTYTYDTADVNLVSKTDPNGKVTTYTYDLVNGKSNGNLAQSVYDPGGTGHLNQTTTYTYDTNNRLKTVQLYTGTLITFGYDADGNRVSKAVTSGGTTTTVLDVYAQGRLVYQTDGSGNKIASFNYDRSGVPESVDLTTSGGVVRYYYVYNGHGDVVALVDATGTSKATYKYDEFGVLTTNTETFPNNIYNWTNPYRYDGAEQVRFDSETGLYWMSVRAYDPTLGRFITHDPLGRLAAQGMDFQPYVYASNNPVNKTDPSGMWSPRYLIDGEYAARGPTPPASTSMKPTKPKPPRCWIPEVCNHGHRNNSGGGGRTTQTLNLDYDGNYIGQASAGQIQKAHDIAYATYNYFVNVGGWLATAAIGFSLISGAAEEMAADLIAQGTAFLIAAMDPLASWFFAPLGLAMLLLAVTLTGVSTVASRLAITAGIAAGEAWAVAAIFFKETKGNLTSDILRSDQGIWYPLVQLIGGAISLIAGFKLPSVLSGQLAQFLGGGGSAIAINYWATNYFDQESSCLSGDPSACPA
jgi:RHS repeat-associated protein